MTEKEELKQIILQMTEEQASEFLRALESSTKPQLLRPSCYQ